MEHQFHFADLGLVILVATLAAIFMAWMRQLPMVGYVVAGVLLGPGFLAVIESEADIRVIAEIGVILLLFILGMELPLQSFRNSYKPALIVSLGLVAVSLGLMFFIGLFMDLSLAEKIIYGFIISLSSTAVAIKLLESVDLKTKGTGQIAISVLIAQDILFVPMMMIINAMGRGDIENTVMDMEIIVKIVLSLTILIALMAYLLRREKIDLPFRKTVEKHIDLIPVAALAWCFVGAGLSEAADMSPAYGAFIAGLILGNSHSKEKILHRIEPMQHVLIMVFFLSVGMLLDFNVIWGNLGLIMTLLIGSMLFKTVICVFLLKVSLPADRWRCSFVSGLTISQIGEFSFILAATGLQNGIITNESYKIVLSVIALSLVLSPLWMAALSRFVEIAYRQPNVNALGQALQKFITLTPTPKTAE